MMEHSKAAPLIWIIAGESSGDLYGARLAQDIRKTRPQARIAGMGGVKMKNAGVDILVDSSELGVIGLIEVLGSIFKFILKAAKSRTKISANQKRKNSVPTPLC